MNVGNAHRTVVKFDVQPCKNNESPKATDAKGSDKQKQRDVEAHDTEDGEDVEDLSSDAISTNNANKSRAKTTIRNGKNNLDKSKRFYYRG